MRFVRREKLWWRARTARRPEIPAAALASQVERHLCVLLALDWTWAGTQGRSTRLPTSWARGPTNNSPGEREIWSSEPEPVTVALRRSYGLERSSIVLELFVVNCYAVMI